MRKRVFLRVGLATAVAMGVLSLLPDFLFYVKPSQPDLNVGGFDFVSDRFAFANETVWHYSEGTLQSVGLPDDEQIRQQAEGGHRYTRRCFVLARAALQFRKFALFKPDATPINVDELAVRIKAVASTSVWRSPYPDSSRIIIPGFSCLYELSAAHPEILQDNLGAGWPTYFRIGNMPIIFPPNASHQRRVFQHALEHIQSGSPVVLWLCNFPTLNINHSVLAYHVTPQKGSDDIFQFTVYDPNDATEAKTLTYNSRDSRFHFQPTFYFPGGPVRVRPVYLSPLQ